MITPLLQRLRICHTAVIKLKSAWFYALSKIFHVKGSDVTDFISEMCERYCFETEVANRQTSQVL